MTTQYIRDFGEVEIQALRESFLTADPFPHLVIDDLLTIEGQKAAADFPGEDWLAWSRFGDEYQRGKSTCNDISKIPERLASLIHELNSPKFLNTLEKITNIEKIIPDPYLSGGGLHSTGEGGILVPHTDFHVYRELDLYRNINLILYLNPQMTDTNGGALELYKKGEKTPSRSVAPLMGRTVLFRTDDRSVHGFMDPVGPIRRNSIALYYYRSTETKGFAGDATTHWQHHGASGGVRGLRLAAYKTLLFISRGFSKLAHMANPNMIDKGAI